MSEEKVKSDKPLTRDEFFKKESAVRLTEEEAEVLKRVAWEDRRNWKIREFV